MIERLLGLHEEGVMIRTSSRCLAYVAILLFCRLLPAQSPASRSVAARPSTQRATTRRLSQGHGRGRPEDRRRGEGALRVDEEPGIPDHADRSAADRLAADAGGQRLDAASASRITASTRTWRPPRSITPGRAASRPPRSPAPSSAALAFAHSAGARPPTARSPARSWYSTSRSPPTSIRTRAS